MSDFAQSLASKDPKTAVNQFCQRHCARPITKEDVIYTTTPQGSSYQTTLKLNCIEGQEFTGELASTQKDAEKSAAQQVLDAFAEQISSMAAKATAGKKKRPASDANGAPATKMPRFEGATAAGSNADAKNKDSKTLLNQFLQKHCARPITKQDVVYTTLQHGSSYQTTLKLNCIEGQEFAGELSPTPKDAEKSAAQQVLDAFSEEVSSMAATASKKKQPASNLNGDAKTAVNQFCQKHCARPITKQDVLYTTVQHGSQFQTTLTLNCIEGQEFAGELAPTLKEAEQSAAQQVLDAFSDQINSMQASASGKKKKSGGKSEGAAGGANSSLTAKVELNAACSRMLRRVMEKGDVSYETNAVEGGFQATVKMPKLPGEWGRMEWAGEVCQSQKDAEQSAAAMALESIHGDPGAPKV